MSGTKKDTNKRKGSGHVSKMRNSFNKTNAAKKRKIEAMYDDTLPDTEIDTVLEDKEKVFFRGMEIDSTNNNNTVFYQLENMNKLNNNVTNTFENLKKDNSKAIVEYGKESLSLRTSFDNIDSDKLDAKTIALYNLLKRSVSLNERIIKSWAFRNGKLNNATNTSSSAWSKTITNLGRKYDTELLDILSKIPQLPKIDMHWTNISGIITNDHQLTMAEKSKDTETKGLQTTTKHRKRKSSARKPKKQSQN